MSSKVPGWGIVRVIEKRIRNGIEEGFVDFPGHEAPFWINLKEVARHKGRVIYEEDIDPCSN